MSPFAAGSVGVCIHDLGECECCRYSKFGLCNSETKEHPGLIASMDRNLEEIAVQQIVVESSKK